MMMMNDGRESDDIDIALDDISGVTFANFVNDYLTEQGLETHSVGVIQVGPSYIIYVSPIQALTLPCPSLL